MTSHAEVAWKPSAREGRGLLGGVLVASVALHVTVVLLLPSTRPKPAPFAPTLIELAEPPPLLAAPAPPPKEESAPEPRPHVAARALPATAPARVAAKEAPTAASPATDLPADFTATRLSSADGAGVAIATGSAAVIATTAATGRVPGATGPVGPRFVAAGDLLKAPRVPRLDAALEKNYPAEARRSAVSGIAVLRVQVLPYGRVGVVQRVTESYSGFGEACERTVRSGVWEAPLDREGRPVATEITYTCRFEIRS